MSLKFVIQDVQVKLLFTPTEFYYTLKDLLQHSKNRIVLSCLYIGKGNLEKELIKSILKNENRENVTIDILLDKQRGTRPEGKLKESSVTVLSELFKYCKNVNISLFHNPLLGAFLYNILPHRVNEAIGVMHMKAFICDDNIILSGANLSENYLSNRQDRYFLIQNKLLADSVHKIINTIQKMSFTLNPNLTIIWNNDLINPLIETHVFREQYYRKIKYLLKELKSEIKEYHKRKLTYSDYTRFFGNEEDEDEENEQDEEIEEEQDELSETNKMEREKVKGTGSGNENKNKQEQEQEKENKNKNKNKKENKKIGKQQKQEHEKQEEQRFCKKRNDFFYPLFENSEKPILVIELALQCGFAIPPIYDESDMIEDLLKNVKANDQSLIIASGYLNFPQNFLKLFRNIFTNITLKKGTLQLVTASPSANSFYKSEGLSYFLPSAYSGIAHLCIEFITKNASALYSKGRKTCSLKSTLNSSLNNCSKVDSKNALNVSNHVQNIQSSKNIYFEYYKPAWTFHSKGMWIINNIDPKKNKHYGNIKTEEEEEEEEKEEEEEEKEKKEEKEEKKVEKRKENEKGAGSSTNLQNSQIEKNSLCGSNTEEENLNSNELPWSTVIGSSNYGYRATYRDLEMSFIIKTNDYNLKCQLQKELNIIYESSKCVNSEDLNLRCPAWLKFLVKYVMKWFL